jgi:hypothetical protein
MASGSDEDLAQAETGVGTPQTLGERPPGDRLARDVARARIGNQLFATSEQVQLGRYHLLEMVGAGGMGVVWGAWDPELERRVAIKLVKATMQAARDRILLEGQALAKLSHPNVVPVYDVGVVDDQVYIVMEWVRGKNLRAYAKEPRTIREILAVFRPAAEGLSAAHVAGLIHRDFKPDNAMLGDDGRVRVLDFGLARGEARPGEQGEPPSSPSSPSSDLTRGAGTPMYMPPEQADGKELTAAVDQYAFCVSLREALAGRHATGKDADVPGWIAAILDRGCAPEPKDRYPSMIELLRALARDPARIWRRRFVIAGALVAAGAAFAIGSLRAQSVEHCGGGEAEIGATWTAMARGTLLAHMHGLGPYAVEEAPRLDRDLDGFARSWAVAHDRACKKSERGELTVQLYERSLGCLARSRAALETIVGVLSTVDTARMPDAVVAARSLPKPEQCLVAMESAPPAPPPAIAAQVGELANEVERVRVLALAQDESARARASAAADAAETFGYAPLIARAQLVRGVALILEHEPPLAIWPLERAAQVALDLGDDVTFVEAYAREVFAITLTPPPMFEPALELFTIPVIALEPRVRDRLGAIDYGEKIANRLGTAGGFARALFFNNVGVSRLAVNDRTGARAWFDKARREPRIKDPNDVELAVISSNLALTADTTQERDLLFAQARAETEKMLGPYHANTLLIRMNAAMLIEDPDRAAAEIGEVCELYRAWRPHLTDDIDQCTYEVGWLAEDRGDLTTARTWFAKVGKTYDRIVAAYVAMFDGRLDVAAREGATEAKMREGLEPWVKFYAVDALLVVAMTQERSSNPEAGIATLRRARAILAENEQPTAFYRRRSARVELQLARLLFGSNREEAVELAHHALAWYRAAGGYAAQVAELDAIIAGSR